jgi:hypothetical protein
MNASRPEPVGPPTGQTNTVDPRTGQRGSWLGDAARWLGMVMLHLALIGAGFFGGYRITTAWELPVGPLSRYTPDLTIFGDGPKHIIHAGGCFTVTADAYYDQIKGVLGHRLAKMPYALNFLIRNDYTSQASDRFFMYGIEDEDTSSHLINLYHALQLPNVKSIVYVNVPGGLLTFTKPRRLPATLSVVDAIAREYPAAAPYAQRYRKALLASRAYWVIANNVTSEFKELKLPPEFRETVSRPGHSDLMVSRVGSLLHLEGRRRTFDPWLHNAAQAMIWYRSAVPLALTSDDTDDFKMRVVLERARKTYLDEYGFSQPLRPAIAPENYWIAAGGDEGWGNFLRMIGEMTRARGVRLVYYVPPHVNLTSQDYAESFKPQFVDRVAEILQAYPNAVLVDQAVNHDLNTADLSWREGHKSGYNINAIGQLKRSDLLLQAMASASILDLPRRETGTPPAGWTWNTWKQRLPAVPDRPKTFLTGEALVQHREEYLREPSMAEMSRRAPEPIEP